MSGCIEKEPVLKGETQKLELLENFETRSIVIKLTDKGKGVGTLSWYW